MKRLHSPTCRIPIAWARLGSLALGLTAISGHAADILSSDASDEGSGWFVRGGPRVLFGVKASVNRLTQTITPGVYDDGFVLPDVGGTVSGRTWNWGYQDNAQVVGSQLRMSRLTGTPMAGLFDSRSFDPSLGGEIIGGMEITRFYIGRREARLGFEAGYGYNTFSLSERSSANSTATLTAGAYNVGSTIVPQAPYAGTFQGPGPLIDLNPSISGTINSLSQASFDGKLENSLHQMKLGFWLDYPLSQRMTTSLSLGYSAVYADSRLKYQETVTFANPALASFGPTYKTVSGGGWRPGMYAQLRLGYDFSRHVGAYLGGDFQCNGNFHYEGEGRSVNLNFQTLLAATVGVIIRF
jgi:hypothetical protein